VGGPAPGAAAPPRASLCSASPGMTPRPALRPPESINQSITMLLNQRFIFMLGFLIWNGMHYLEYETSQ
jgi:hypothetical protein